MTLLNLVTGDELSVDEAYREMQNNRSVADVLDMAPELRRAEELIETLVQERDELQAELEAMRRLHRANELCRLEAQRDAQNASNAR